MKKCKYIILALLFIGIWSCDDDDASLDVLPSESIEINAMLNSPDETEFIVTETTEDVTGNEDETATTFSWSKAEGSYNGSIVYALQLDLEGNNFRNAASLPLDGSTTNELLKEVTFGNLNQVVNKVNTARIIDGAANPIDFSIANEYEVRLISSSNISGNQSFSEKITISITAYEKIIVVEPEYSLLGQFKDTMEFQIGLQLKVYK